MIIGLSLWVLYTPTSATPLDLSPTSVNITITVSPLQGPTVTNGANATSVAATTARLNGEVTDTGNENPTVTVFYGESDGGTTPASWTNNVSLGTKALGAFYYDASGLTPETLHFYRMYAANTGGSDWANSSANFTTIAQLDTPTGFTVADLGCVTVSMNWTMGLGATYTMIRGARDDYPSGVGDGEIIFYGDATSYNSTGYALDTSTYYFSAFAYLADNVTYSGAYATATIGGEGMDEIADAIDGATTIFSNLADTAEMAFGMVLVLGLFAFVLWCKDREMKLVLLVISGLVAVFVGISWVSTSQVLSIAVMGLGTFQLIQAVVLALGMGGKAQGYSQFKGIISSIRGWF